jgi:metal-responsive CopG/Arc/MetJ family transcriptional regulator
VKDGKIRITKKENLKGEDGNSVISVRIKKAILSELDNIAKQTDRSRNEVINILLEQAVENIEID